MQLGAPPTILTSDGYRVLAKSPFRPGTASDYFSQLPSILQVDPNPVAVLYCRVCTKKQGDQGNPADQVGEAIQELQRFGIEPALVVAGTESSRIDDDRLLIWEAIEYARSCNGIIVALSRDRLLRSQEFDGKNSTDLPTIREYRSFLHFASGVAVATLIPPDEPARSDQIKRGQRAKANRGGRPAKRHWKKRRQARIDLARRMRAEGLSFRQIAVALNKREDGFSTQTAKTIQNWLRRGV